VKLAQLQNELVHERAQVDKLKALLEAEQEHVNSLRMALRMIEARPAVQPLPESNVDNPEKRSPQPKANTSGNGLGLFSRIFKKRGG